jgi:hypothetical protein
MNASKELVRGRFVAVLAVTLVFAALAGVPSAVSAGSGQQSASASLSQRGSGPASAEQSTITCTLSIDNPHKSTHVPTTVNVVAHWVCTAPVSSLSMTVRLFRGSTQVGQGSSSNSGQATLNGNAAANCVNGSYHGTATGTVVFPPGYTPSSSTLNVTSNTVSITNC